MALWSCNEGNGCSVVMKRVNNCVVVFKRKNGCYCGCAFLLRSILMASWHLFWAALFRHNTSNLVEYLPHVMYEFILSVYYKELYFH